MPIALFWVIIVGPVSSSHAQSSDTRRQFEVASIKPNASGSPEKRMMPSAGRLLITNMTLKDFLTYAYQVKDYQVYGGPKWIDSDRFDIDARSRGDIPGEQMAGPMLQALLEDRFKLKAHRETKEVPVYRLTVAKNGLKMKPADGTCIAVDPNDPAGRPAGHRPSEFCGFWGMGRGRMDATAMKISDLANVLSIPLSRTVLDRTGVEGRFNLRLRFSPEDSAPGAAPAPPAAPGQGGPSTDAEPAPFDLYGRSGTTGASPRFRQGFCKGSGCGFS